MDVEQGTLTPLAFTTTGGGEECKRYHNRLAELVTERTICHHHLVDTF